jgi:dihydrodipicolinate synthase/N-acetylneuraminate lyase
MRVNYVTALLIAAGFHGALKEALRILGLDCGQPRLPGLPFPADQSSRLRQKLAAVGFQALADM